MNPILTGRFAPLLNSHLAAIEGLAGAVTLVVTGAEASRQARFPWTADERIAMIRAALGDGAARVTFTTADDNPYLGERPECPSRSEEEAICAAYFSGDDLAGRVPPPVAAWLDDFRQTADYARLEIEARYIADYRASWRAAPWPPAFVTVDTCITCSGRLLLIQRGGQPGQGLWALPGGFIDAGEWLHAAALRELREETGLVLGRDAMTSWLQQSHVFDDPWRSARGRTITHGFHFALPGAPPPVSGSDDARDARWWPLAELGGLRNGFLEDHGQMIAYFLSRRPL